MPEDDFLHAKLEERAQKSALRALGGTGGKTDFCSNDYLGLAASESFRKHLADDLARHRWAAGSTGSRLLTGNHPLFEKTEAKIARFHRAEAALIFNSGYDANLGLLSALADRGDAVLYDTLVHASLRDGIRLSLAPSYSFVHNDLYSLERKLIQVKRRCFVVVESVYSMDGDQAPLAEIAELCSRYGAHLIVDEAHATGVIGSRGEGLVQALHLAGQCLARIHTFGKALGVHGAAVVGGAALKQYLVNFARPFIYTTAMPPAAVAAIAASYSFFPKMTKERTQLAKLIRLFRKAELPFAKLPSFTPIQGVLVPGNDAVKAVARHLQLKGLDVRPILHPTVPAGQERLRIVLHSFNTTRDVNRLVALLQAQPAAEGPSA